jgi:hypothetical protein
MTGIINITVATVTAYSAAKRIMLSEKEKYDGGFTAIFKRKPQKIEEAAINTIDQSRLEATLE